MMRSLTVVTAEGAPLDFVQCAPEDVSYWRARLMDLYRAWGACYVVEGR